MILPVFASISNSTSPRFVWISISYTGLLSSSSISNSTSLTCPAYFFFAIEIALEKVKGEVDDVELEMHDGSYVYVVEIEREEDDALVYVQAYTGEILHITFE